MSEQTLSRRKFLIGAGVAAGGAMLSFPAVARTYKTATVGPDRLWLMRSDSGETINIPYIFEDPDAHRAAWARYSYFWRDLKDGGKAVWMDPRLLVYLSALQVHISGLRGEETLLILNSGYRTPEHNASVEGAAPNSFHCRACAADFWSPKVTNRAMRALAVRIRGVGGVGGYSGFTHIDTGPQGRRWGKAALAQGEEHAS